MTQPETLRLADEVDEVAQTFPDMAEVSAELRRLHAENEAIRNVANRGGHIAVAMSRITYLEAQRDALLEVAKTSLCVLCALLDANDWHPNMHKDIEFAIEGNRYAIAAVEGVEE